MRRAFALVMLSLVAACARAPAPSAWPALPTLVRPVLALHADARRENLWLPAPALVVRGGIPGVFVLDDARARFRMVKPGKTARGRVQILAGLTGNESVVLGDLAPVHDGSPITTQAGKGP